jgi:PAS domain S-box-containing protein
MLSMDITPASSGYHLAEVVLEELADAGVFLLDWDRRIQSWGPTIERVLGYSEAQVVGSKGNDLFTPEDREQGTT